MMERGALPVVTPEPIPGSPLTGRQTQVVAAAIDGQLDDETAEELFLSRRTAETTCTGSTASSVSTTEGMG